MNRKRKLYLMLLFAFVFGLFSLNSQAFAQEMNSTAKTAIEAGEIKADAEANATVDGNAKSQEPSQEGENLAEEGKDLESSEESNALDKKEATLEVAEEKEAQSVASDDPETKGIYLNGESGNDEYDGSSENLAVRTFKKAKELIEKEVNKAITNIFVTGTTSVEGEIRLDKKDAKLVRHKDFNDYLLKVEENKTATLKNITIDGNSKNNKNIEKSLVRVEDGATLNIKDGAVLRNNEIKNIKDTATEGGAVNAYNATVNMTGGIIEENQATYGGGVYLYGSTMDFSGGIVRENKSRLVYDSSYNQYYSAGGGIAAYEGSTINMSGNAEVSKNSAAEIGGGISLGTNQQGTSNLLEMTGGTISGNKAGATGGGLFIQSGLHQGNQSIAKIYAGRITNNVMTGKGKTDYAFGGGGIYVNGLANPWKWQGHTYYGANGELHLKNVLITDNESKWEGAGMANCPISKTTIHVNNGVAFDQNKAGRPGNDVFIYSNEQYGIHSGNAIYKLSKRMLGGGLFNWTKPDGKALPDAEHEGTLVIPKGEKDAKFAANSNPEDIKLAKALAKVIISGNYSETRGGGIGSNGDVTIGTNDGTTKVKVEKKWDDKENANNKRPNTIKVQLYATVDGEEYLVETKEVKAQESWKAEFKDLPTLFEGAKVTYTIKEVAIDGYTSEVTGDQANGFTVTNKEKPEESKTRDIKVSKRWDLAGSEKPVENIDVELYRNGESTGKTLKLNAGNNWSGVFEGLEIADKETPAAEYRYTVKEVGEVRGLIQFGGKEFEVSYSGDMTDGFTITNKEKPERPPEEPPTPPTRDIHIVKKWDLVGNDKPVARIEIELYRDGKATGKVIELNESNNWSGSFTGLDVRDGSDPSRDYVYTVKEWGENGGFLRLGDRDFDVSYEGSMESGFVITNKEKPETPPETPPEEPGKPEEPETPETPDVPDKPEKPNKPGKPGAPQTGVGSDMGLWAGLASMSAAALGFMGTKKRRDEE